MKLREILDDSLANLKTDRRVFCGMTANVDVVIPFRGDDFLRAQRKFASDPSDADTPPNPNIASTTQALDYAAWFMVRGMGSEADIPSIRPLAPLIDMLPNYRAVAIGTAHGFYKKEPKLDFDRLKKIRQLSGNLPIVLHGGTGVPDEAVKEAIKLGVRKINFSTVIRAEYIKAFRKATNDNLEEWGLMELSEFGMKAVKAQVSRCINLMGCAGKDK
jgi:Fructose/tagatose bisphosphate aldolase